MTKTITTIALAILIGCNNGVEPHSHDNFESGQVQQEQTDTGTHQEVSETRNQVEFLSTQCDEYSEIELEHDDVIVLSITHYTGSNLRQQVDGWRKSDETENIMIASCADNVEVTYMYR